MFICLAEIAETAEIMEIITSLRQVLSDFSENQNSPTLWNTVVYMSRGNCRNSRNNENHNFAMRSTFCDFSDFSENQNSPTLWNTVVYMSRGNCRNSRNIENHKSEKPFCEFLRVRQCKSVPCRTHSPCPVGLPVRALSDDESDGHGQKLYPNFLGGLLVNWMNFYIRRRKRVLFSLSYSKICIFAP